MTALATWAEREAAAGAVRAAKARLAGAGIETLAGKPLRFATAGAVEAAVAALDAGADVAGIECAAVAGAIGTAPTNGAAHGAGPDGSDPAARLADAVRAIAEASRPATPEIDAEAVRAIVADALASYVPPAPPVPTFRVETGTVTREVAGHAHAALARALARVGAGFRNLLLVGPAGSGKTTLARQLAEGLGRPFRSLSCDPTMSGAAFYGRRAPGASGAWEYEPTEFVRGYEEGAVILLDEFDAAPGDVTVAINAALGNGHFPVPSRSESPVATRHADTVIIGAANTYGRGGDRLYVRGEIDGATLDRFMGATLDVDYDADLERRLAPATVCNAVHAIRANVTRGGMRRVVSTRAVEATARLVAAGFSLADAVGECLAGWTADERARALAGVIL